MDWVITNVFRVNRSLIFSWGNTLALICIEETRVVEPGVRPDIEVVQKKSITLGCSLK